MIADQIDDFRAEHGRDPTWTEVYLTHQQGRGGLAAHVADPERLAWRSMWSTAEGRARGEGWAREAIWRNVPGGSPHTAERITSGEFVEIWRAKVERRRLALTPATDRADGRERPSSRPCRIARVKHWWEVVAP